MAPFGIGMSSGLSSTCFGGVAACAAKPIAEVAAAKQAVSFRITLVSSSLVGWVRSSPEGVVELHPGTALTGRCLEEDRNGSMVTLRFGNRGLDGCIALSEWRIRGVDAAA